MNRVLAVLIATLCAVVPAAAQEAKPGATPEVTRNVKQATVDPVVVTATKLETPRSQIGAAVTVITEDELRTFNQYEVGEALRPVPGVEIQRAGGPGKATSIRIRGANPNQVQVLVDGLRVKSPTLGTTDLAEFPIDAVDRIEIVRGAQSGLYGADAIGGVVNIITRKGQGPARGSVHLEGGSYETFRQRAGVQGAYGGFNFNVAGSHYSTIGQFDNDDAWQLAFAGRFGYDFPWKGELSLTGRYIKTHTDLPFDVFPPLKFEDPNMQQQLETSLFTVAYEQPILDWWEVKARYGQWWNNSGFQDDAPPAFDTPLDTQINTRRLEAELINAFRLGKWSTLSVGGEYRDERGSNRGAFKKSIATGSLFVQDELRLFDRLFLTGSVRYEDNEVFGDETTPRVGAALVIKETGTRVRGAWGEGFRAPTINDLFFPDLTGGLCPSFGNPDLEPERSTSWEAGVDQDFWQRRIRLSGTYFHNSFDDLITVVDVPPTPAGVAAGFPGCAQSGNVGRARTQGLEFSAEIEPLDWLLLFVTYTYTDTEDLETGLELRRFARHRWATGLVVHPIERLSLFAQAFVVSSQLESTFAGRNPGYHRIDFGGTYRLVGRVGAMERLEFTARVENVTNQTYDEVFGFRALGFNALVGLRAYFE
ncbi:MAG: TonB-dependent receptor plug domain-containing protein [Candidatus Rokuibacteriota bacterium]